MDLKAEKLNIMRWLENVNDEAVIRQFLILKHSSEHQSIRLSDDERQAIDQGIRSVDSGHFKRDEEIKSLTRNKFPNLF